MFLQLLSPQAPPWRVAGLLYFYFYLLLHSVILNGFISLNNSVVLKQYAVPMKKHFRMHFSPFTPRTLSLVPKIKSFFVCTLSPEKDHSANQALVTVL
jgi:hypothetical protein